MAEELTTPEVETEATEAPARPRSMLKLVLPLLLLVGLGVGGWLIFRTRAKAQTPPAEVKVVAVFHLESFVVNLADTENRSFLRIGIDLGLTHAQAAEKEGGPTAAIRDTIFGVLSTYKSDDLLTADGKNKLKQSLVQALAERIPELGVREVYFTEFLVQR